MFKISKKQITKGQRKYKQVFILNPTKKSNLKMDRYVPFSNLALCPKQVIAFVQRPTLDFDELDQTIQNLKMPSSAKRLDTLNKMRALADKQELYQKSLSIKESQFNSIETVSRISDHSEQSSIMSQTQPGQQTAFNYQYTQVVFTPPSPLREEVDNIPNTQTNYIVNQSLQNSRVIEYFYPDGVVQGGFDPEPQDFNQFLNF